MTTQTPPAYRGVLSARSRRLRTGGSLLLLALLGMGAYGYLVLMPTLRVAQAGYARIQIGRPNGQVRPPGTTQPATTGMPAPERERARKVLLTNLIFAYAYWGIWTALFVALLVIAWLDAREVWKNYLTQRAVLWTEAAVRARREASTRNGSSDGS